MRTTVTKKGQVTIPKTVREWLDIEPGSAVDFELAPDGRVILTKAGRKSATLPSRFARMRGTATVQMTTDEIMRLMRGDA